MQVSIVKGMADLRAQKEFFLPIQKNDFGYVQKSLSFLFLIHHFSFTSHHSSILSFHFSFPISKLPLSPFFFLFFISLFSFFPFFFIHSFIIALTAAYQYHQPDLYHEEVLDLDSPFASIVHVGTQVFSFLLLGDQNAGKSTFLHSFTYPWHHCILKKTEVFYFILF